MNPLTTLKLALRALWRNKVRSLLTMLGIVFGIGAVIAMVSGGQGAQAAVKEVFTNMGANVLQVMNGNVSTFGAAGGANSRQSLTWKDLDAIREEIPTIKYVVPILATKSQVAAEEFDQNWNTTINGTTATWFTIRNWEAAHGRLFDEDAGTAKVAIVGNTVATQLFGSASTAVGQKMRIGNNSFEVIGVLVAKGAGPQGDLDDTVIIPLETYRQKLERIQVANYVKGQFLVQMTGDDVTERTISALTGLLRQRHNIDGTEEDDFRIRNPAEFAKAQQDSTNRIATLLAIVAGVSLFVGGIGVMNIMLVSVIERTREIGIRMAVGAKPVDVMTQFLVESLVLSAVGGLLGLALGYGAAYGMSQYFGWKFFFPAATAAIAFAVAGGVGVAFGLYPAVRASQLDPITALRYES